MTQIWSVQNSAVIRRTAPGGGVRLTGSNTVRYEDLYTTGNDIRAVMQKVPAGKVLTLPAGTFTFSDFQTSSPYYAGLTVPSNVAGLAGSGIGQTILQMVPNTSTRSGLVPNQSQAPATNPLYLLQADGGSNQLFQQFTLQGTDQGHIYGGFALSHSTNGTIQDILVQAVPGDRNAPPGETFCINVWQGSGMIGNRIEVDGRDSNGSRIAASPFGYNSHSGSTLTDCYFHHALASTFTYWQTHDCVTYNVRSEHNGNGVTGQTAHGINHERAYSITHHNPTVLPLTDTNGNTSYHMSWNSDVSQYVGQLTVYNPTFDNDSRGSGKFIIMSFATYNGVSNTQTTKPLVYDAAGQLLPNFAWAH